MLTFIGYIPLRRGLLQHLHEGRLTPAEFNLYVTLLMWADHRTGIATTNATGLVFLSGDQFDLKYTRKCLASLEEKGYIKRPFFVQGQRGDQQMFIDKFVVTDGVLKGKVLSFADTTDWKNPAYVEISEEGSEKGSEEGTGKGRGNAPSNEKPKTEKGEVRQKKSVLQPATGVDRKKDSSTLDKRQEQPQGQDLNSTLRCQLSESKEQQQEQPPVLCEECGATPDACICSPSPVNPAPKAHPPIPPPPFKKETRHWSVLRDMWNRFTGEVEIPGINPFDWGTPDARDFAELLKETPDTMDTILAVAWWGATVSKFWFKPGKGQIEGFTGFRNAYPAMRKQHQAYTAKAEGATV